MESVEVWDESESTEEVTHAHNVFYDRGDRLVTLTWNDSLPVVPNRWSGRKALERACVKYIVDDVPLNPHAMAAAFRFVSRNRLKESVAKSLQSYTTVFGVRGNEFQAEVIALYPSSWEQSVLVYATGDPERPLTRCATYRDEQWGSDGVRLRALGTDEILDHALVAVAFDVYHLSPQKIFELFKSHPLAVEHAKGRPGARMLVVGRYFQTSDASLYVDTFPTDEEPYMEGFGVINNGVIEFRASQGNAHDSEYSHSVLYNKWLYETSRLLYWPVNTGNNCSFMDVGIHREWVVGPYVCVSLSIQIHHFPATQEGKDHATRVHHAIQKRQAFADYDVYVQGNKGSHWKRPMRAVRITPPRSPHHFITAGLVPSLLPFCFQQVSGMDERNQAALSSAHRAGVRELVRVLGNFGYSLLCEQTWGGVEDRYLVSMVVPSVLRTLEYALATVNGLRINLPECNVWRAAVIEARSKELHDRLGLWQPVADTLAVGVVGSRFDFVMSVGGLFRGGINAIIDAASSLWRWVSDAYSRWFSGVASGNLLSSLAALWRSLSKLKTWVETKIGRVRNLLRALTLFDWLPFMDHDMNLNFTSFALLVTGVVFEELLKHEFPLVGVVWCALEFMVWMFNAFVSEIGLPLDEVIILRVAVILMHSVCLMLPLRGAILIHALWNLAAQAFEKAGHRICLEGMRNQAEAALRSIIPDPRPEPIAVANFPAVESSLVAVDAMGQEVDPTVVAEEEDPLNPTAPRRFKWFEAPVSECFAQPAANIASATVVVGCRLDVNVPLPKPSMIDAVKHNFEYAVRWLPVEDTWKPFDYGMMVDYVMKHPSWGTGRKKELCEVLEKVKRGVDVPSEKVIFTKTDELLLLKLIQSIWRLKVRPIHPMDLAQFCEMMAVVPFKNYLSRTWWLVRDGAGRLRYTLEESPSCVGSITYLSDPTPAKKDAWANEFSSKVGVHCLGHGDDEITFIFTDALRTEASDLASCDLTCHGDFQELFLYFRHHTCSDPAVSRALMERYMTSLTGKFKYQVSSSGGVFKLVFTKENASTNTGHPATAQLAFGVQFVMFPTVMRRMPLSCRKANAMHLFFMQAKTKCYKEYGLLPEPEPSDLNSLSSHSFLASIPVSVGDRITWASFAFVKTFLFYPDPIKVWGRAGTPGHVAAIYLTDPLIDSTPIHRAFGRLWRKVAEYYQVSDFEWVESTWLSWLSKQDPYRYEIERTQRKEARPVPIPDEFFFRALEEYVSGWSSEPAKLIMDVHRLIDELDSCSPDRLVLTDCSLVLIKLRYRDDQARLLETDLGGVFQGSATGTYRAAIKILFSYMDANKKTQKTSGKSKNKPRKEKHESTSVTTVSQQAPKPKTITRVTHVPMQSVKMIKMGGAVVGATNFTPQDYSINAGNSALWPRLSQVARTYQYWRATNWSIRYEPIASMFGANKSGVVTLSLLQNWYDAPPDNMTAQTERATRSVTVPAWESATLKLDATKWKYVRDSPGSQGQDMRLDDEVIEVGVEGTDVGSVGVAIGYLYLSADIEFKVPYTVSLNNAPRTNTVFALGNNTDRSLPATAGGTPNSLSLTPGSGGFLVNSNYTGAGVVAGVLNLYGGTYVIRYIANYICGSAPAFVRLYFLVGGVAQSIQVDGASSLTGTMVPLTDAYARFLTAECVVTVPEGGLGTVTPVAVCTQAASVAITETGFFCLVMPH